MKPCSCLCKSLCKDACSLKPPCGMLKFKQLLERYLLEGFTTGQEPLIVSLNPALNDLGLDALWNVPDGEETLGPPLGEQTR